MLRDFGKTIRDVQKVILSALDIGWRSLERDARGETVKTGLLTLDAKANRTFRKKVALAVVYYRRRHGVLPDVVYVHPSALPDGEMEIGGVTVKPLRTVLRHHFWTGREEK